MVMMVVMPVRILWWACLHLRPVAGGRIAGTAAGGSQAGQIRTGRTVQPVLVPAVDAFPRQAKVFVSLRVSHRWLLLPTVVPMVLLLVRMGMVVAGVMVLSRFLHRVNALVASTRARIVVEAAVALRLELIASGDVRFVQPAGRRTVATVQRMVMLVMLMMRPGSDRMGWSSLLQLLLLLELLLLLLML